MRIIAPSDPRKIILAGTDAVTGSFRRDEILRLQPLERKLNSVPMFDLVHGVGCDRHINFTAGRIDEIQLTGLGESRIVADLHLAG